MARKIIFIGTAVAVGAISVLLVHADKPRRIVSYAVARPAAARAPIAWQWAVYLPHGTLTLPGAWLSWAQCAHVPNQPRAGTDELSVAAEDIEAALASGSETSQRPPIGCTVALKWEAATQQAWYDLDRGYTDENGCNCEWWARETGSPTKAEREAGEARPIEIAYRATILDPREATNRKLYRQHQKESWPGHGEVTIRRDGTISIGPNMMDGEATQYGILAAVATNGDVYFYVVKRQG